MNTKILTGSQPHIDEEYKQQIDRMIPEIEAMLANARRMSAQSRIIGDSNRRRLNALEEQMLESEKNWVDKSVERERELRESAMRELRLEQQLRISEELRRLGPKSEN